MKALLRAVFAAASALASVTATARSHEDDYFLETGVGEAVYHLAVQGDGPQPKSTASALRVGYAWEGPVVLGVEAGYADLGSAGGAPMRNAVFESGSARVSGWLLGGDGTWRFAGAWHASVRAGWMRDTIDAAYHYSDPATSIRAGGSADGNGWYGGMGLGYDFANGFSLGLNYDNYHLAADTDVGRVRGNVATFMLSTGYRF